MNEIFRNLKLVFKSNRTKTIEWRISQLEALAKGVKETHEAICQAVYDDLHRPFAETLQSEVLGVLGEIDFVVKNLSTWVSPQEVDTPKTMQPAKCFHYFKPKGVVLIVSPFNFPVYLALMPLIGAIGAGNCVVLKPSEMTPASAKYIYQLVHAYLDRECIHVLLGGVEETTHLLSLPFDHFFYTGNGRVGKLVMHAAANVSASVTLELGGKSPVYVHSDANLSVAARRIVHTKFMNAGQMCVTADYLVVHESIFAALVKEIQHCLTMFYPNAKESMTYVVNARQVKRLQDAVFVDAHNGTVMQSQSVDGLFFPPTLVLNPRLGSTLMTDEIFGPVLPLYSVTSLQHALEVIESVDTTPLASYVFTEDDHVADAFLSHVQSGGGCVNALVSQLSNPALFFGGVKSSGLGGYRGRHSFVTFSNQQAVVKRPTTSGENLALYPPYSPKLVKILKSMM